MGSSPAVAVRGGGGAWGGSGGGEGGEGGEGGGGGDGGPAPFYDLVDAVRPRLEALGCYVCAWGHLGDMNLHLNVAAPDDDLAGDGPARDALEPFVYEFAAAARGSISAEHGVGQCKAHKLPLQRSDAALATMRALKDALDPHAILNPGKVLPAVDS